MMGTTETPSYLTYRVQNAMRDVFKVTHALPKKLQKKDLTAVEGLLLRRNPWHNNTQPQVWCLSDLHPPIWVTLRGGPELQAVTGPSRHKETLSPYAPIKQRWGIEVEDGYYDDARVDFDISYSAQDPTTKLCTVSWTLSRRYFKMQKHKHRRKWYGGRQKVRYLEFDLILFVVDPLRAGPQFEIHPRGRYMSGEVVRPMSVEWYGSPLHIVLAKKVSRGRLRVV